MYCPFPNTLVKREFRVRAVCHPVTIASWGKGPQGLKGLKGPKWEFGKRTSEDFPEKSLVLVFLSFDSFFIYKQKK